MRVLVVDDDGDCRSAYERFLGGAGATVVTAAAAEEGLAAFCRSRPHVVVSDLAMPGEDGCWLVRRILAAADGMGWRPRAVAMTGRSDERTRARCLEAGFDVFLAKPLDPVLLAAVVAQLARDVTPL